MDVSYHSPTVGAGEDFGGRGKRTPDVWRVCDQPL